MILYFSSTGNCKYAAEQIAAKTVDRAMSLSAAYQNGEFSILPEPGEALGFVLPTLCQRAERDGNTNYL